MNKGEMAVGTYSHPMEHFGVLLFLLKQNVTQPVFFSNIMFKFQVKNMIIFRPRLGFQLLKLAIMVLKVATPPLGKTVVSGGERLVAKGR